MLPLNARPTSTLQVGEWKKSLNALATRPLTSATNT